jgi:hypothetical protein
MLPMLTKIIGFLPTHTRGSEDSESLEQFSTLIGLASAASQGAAISPTDVVPAPSAGTGLLAVLAELARASAILDEFAESPTSVFAQLFPAASVTQFDAAHINDHRDPGVEPSVALMNLPISVAVYVDFRTADGALLHVEYALACLPAGGRLVVHHSDFDVLIPSHSRIGKLSGGTRISMLLGTPG